MKPILLLCAWCWCIYAQAQITLDKKDESCAGRKDGRIVVKVEGVNTGLEYQWSKNGQPFPGGKAVYGLEPGDYSVTVSTSSGCMGMKSAKIWGGKTVSVNINAKYVTHTPKPTPCGVRPSYTFNLTAIPSGGTPPYYCSWGEGGGSMGACTKVVSGSFIDETVVLIDSLGCVDSDGWSIKALTKMCPRDPNDIAGPDGFDTARWVSVNDEMDYTVRFENDPIFATSNASLVFITIPIDDDIDPFSLRLSSIGFGNQIIQIPENVSFFQDRLDYSQNLGFWLDVTAGLDLPNNRFFWIMETIDPATGQPPTDPTAGFLPVNDTLTGSGEGFINFICKPNESTPTGEVVSHQASIVFDINDPLLTNTWNNTIDAFAPSTSLNVMLDTFYTNVIPFEWSVNDDPGGCGVQYSEVLLSTDKAIFETTGLLNDSTDLSVTLNWNTLYYYKIEGTDHVFNEEEGILDSFFIVPQRDISFVTPQLDAYCIGDTLPVEIALLTVAAVDLYISIDSGYTYTPLGTGIDTWPYPLYLDSALLHPFVVIKARSEVDDLEAITDPFSINSLPIVDAGLPASGCLGELLYVEGNGANNYLWSPDSIMGNPSSRYSNIYADESQFAFLTGTDAYGCQSIDSVFLTIYPGSRDTLTQPICEGDSIWLNGEWISEEGYYDITFADIHDCDSTIVTEVFFESPCIWTGGPYVYVDQDATGDNNGTSWDDAFNELNDAIYVAGRYENVQEIWVAEGIYSPHPTRRDTSFILKDSIRIYGGFLGIEATREERTADPELVFLSGDINLTDTLWDNSYHTVVLSPSCVECVLDGLTIHYGYADQAGNDTGAGILNSGKGQLYNVIFERNYATELGAAVYSSGGGATLQFQSCTFRLNTSSLGRDVVNLNGSEIRFEGVNSLY
jgi:hypothetical protein